jgi:hypothetical protein
MPVALKMAGREKWYRIGRLSMGWGFSMLQGSILIDALFSACWEK